MIRILLSATALAACAFASSAATFATLSGKAPLVIAHRGASGYLPEHTLGGYELAIRMGADIVEPDLQVTADGRLVAMHDGTLNRTTNVETLFAPRNGGYAVSDFTLDEIKTLTVEPTGATASTSYPGFAPSAADPFKVPTFQEVLDFVNAHNAATGDRIGVYPEAKTPNTTSMNQQIVDTLKANGFADRAQLGYIQTFSHAGAAELNALLDLAGIDNAIAALGYVVKSGDDYGVYDAVSGTISSLDDLATYADGVGVNLGFDLDADFIALAHSYGLEVHGWTFRPKTIEEATAQFQPWIDAGMDAFFTDYPDLGRTVVDMNVAPVPLPAALPMLLAGLGGLLLLRRRAS